MTHRTDPRDEKHEMEMTPMIDVTFLLLIFFMCTLKFKSLEGQLAAYLPKDVGTQNSHATPLEKIDIRMEVLEEGVKLDPAGAPWSGKGRFVYDATRRLSYAVGARRTTSLGELGARLDALFQADPTRPVTVDAADGVVYEDVVRVLDQALDAGFTDLTFVGARRP